MAVEIIGLPGNRGIVSLRRYGEVSYLANASQGFASESIGANGLEILKGGQLARRVPFAQDGEVFLLHGRSAGQPKCVIGRKHTWMPHPLSVICRSFKPPSLTKISRLVAPASMAFSSNSLRALTGATMISPAAILLTTSGCNALIQVQ